MTPNETPSESSGASELKNAIKEVERLLADNEVSFIQTGGTPLAIEQLVSHQPTLLSAAKSTQSLEQEIVGIKTGLSREFDTPITDEDDICDLVGEFIDHHKLKEARIKELEQLTEKLVEALKEVKDKGHLGNHSGHWDDTMQYGRGCPICIDQRDATIKVSEALSLAQQTGFGKEKEK